MRNKIKSDNTKISVEKFCIDNLDQREIYISLLNDSSIQIIREELFNDKIGKTHVTLWIQKEV